MGLGFGGGKAEIFDDSRLKGCSSCGGNVLQAKQERNLLNPLEGNW